MGFALEPSPTRFRLALVRTRLADDAETGCTFLITPGGDARCGIGPLRPAACRSYPMQLIDDVLTATPEHCDCAWSDTAFERSADDDRAMLDRERFARITDARIVVDWNAYVAGRGSDAPSLDHRDYCRYVMDRYQPSAS